MEERIVRGRIKTELNMKVSLNFIQIRQEEILGQTAAFMAPPNYNAQGGNAKQEAGPADPPVP